MCASMVIASVVMPPWCPHVGAVGRGLPARVCYVRVGVGSAVYIVPPPTLRREQVRDNELSWVSASHRGLLRMPNKPDNSRLNIFGEHKTTEQTKVLSESDVYSV